MAKKTMRIKETDLYAPIKVVLEAQGYTVKGEVGKVDIMACRGDEEPVIVELKTGFTLALFHQAVDRLALSERVYIAAPHRPGKAAKKSLKRNIALCRVLGLGVMTVRLRDGHVQIYRDPVPYRPRRSKTGSARLLKEFAQREGDPNLGGSSQTTLITAYRQDAMKCRDYLQGREPTKAAHVAKATGVTRARNIMADNHYGWFQRDRPGYYELSE